MGVDFYLNWPETEITQEEHYLVWRNMVDYGGSFVRLLGKALCRADEDNARRIKEAWPEYWAKYHDIGKEVEDEEN